MAMRPKDSVMTPNLSRFHVQELSRHWPFSGLSNADLALLVEGLKENYYEKNEIVIKSGQIVPRLGFLRQGQIRGFAANAGDTPSFVREAGDVFPVGAFWGQRPVRTDYVAASDCFVLWLEEQAVREVAERSPVWAEFLGNAVHAQLQAALKQLQSTQSQWLQQQQAFESPLSSLPRREPLTLKPEASVREGLAIMREAKVGSVLICRSLAATDLLGIVTRDDVISRVTWVGLDLATPIETIMTRPVQTLTIDHSLHDAAVLMSQSRIRHIPLIAEGRLHSIVSERDLFTLQRFSSRQISAQIRQANDLKAFEQAAHDIRTFARMLLGQGVQAASLTELISHLNDVLTQQLLAHHAQKAGLDLSRACWVALGSEGRGEQTVSTDQDNAWILADDMSADEQQAFIAMAARVNQDLDACGYPLCKGGIMASNPECALTLSQWRDRFHAWTHHASPQDLLKASVFFDMRALAGESAWPQQLLDQALAWAQSQRRFMTLLAQNHLQFKVPLDWLGGLQAEGEGEEAQIDLKLHGTALAVDAARILCLGSGVRALSTRERLLKASPKLGIPEAEAQSWVAAFEHLQVWRMGLQLAAPDPANAGNRLALQGLATYQRRVLRESFKTLQGLQQRVELTWGR